MTYGINGLDYLGLGSPYFPLELARDLTPQGWAIGCFDTTFGPALPKLEVLLATGKFPALRVHIWWDDNHNIVPLTNLVARVPAYERLAIEHPNTKIYISHSCEHNCKIAAIVQKRMQIIRTMAPHCVPVNCPGDGVLLPIPINEHHDPYHALTGNYFTSTDGAEFGAGSWSVDGLKWQKTHAQALIRFGWIPEFNGRTTNGPKLAIPQRKVFATADQIKQCINLMQS